jgi:hypothetical protein
MNDSSRCLFSRLDIDVISVVVSLVEVIVISIELLDVGSEQRQLTPLTVGRELSPRCKEEDVNSQVAQGIENGGA